MLSETAKHNNKPIHEYLFGKELEDRPHEQLLIDSQIMGIAQAYLAEGMKQNKKGLKEQTIPH